MKRAIKNMTATTKTAVYIILYCIPLAIALLPPLYLWGSGRTSLFLGAPLSIWYWLLDFIVLIAIMFFFYWMESVRGEVDPETDTPTMKEGE